MLIEGAGRNKFLEKKELVNGEHLQIVDAGWREESKKYTNKDGSPKTRYMFNVRKQGQVYTTEFNWTSVKALCSMYGAETDSWGGRWVQVNTFFDPAKRLTMIYFNPVEKSQEDKLNEMTKKTQPVEAVADGKPLTPDNIEWSE